MQERIKYKLDPIDIMIIRELASDGRIPVMQLAAKTGIGQRAVHNRLNRIISEGIIKIAAIPTMRFTGLTIAASVGFNVKPGYSVHEVAEKLTEYPGFCSVALTSGPYDIVTWAFFRCLEDLSSFLRREISKIPGIASTETLIHLDTVKNVLTYPISEAGPNENTLVAHDTEIQQGYRIDKLDISIIEVLQKDGRMPVVELAKNLGISRISTAKRLQRLLSEGIIKVIAITEPGSFGNEVAARIAINVFPGAVDDVAHKIASFSQVHFVAITVGHYDILCGVHFSELQELSDFIRDGLDKIPDITKTENMIYLEVIKSPFEFITTTISHHP